MGGLNDAQECPVCREQRIEEERLELKREEAKIRHEKYREMMRKWDKYINSLPPYTRFTFDVLGDNKYGSYRATADTETEEQARNKLNQYIADCGGGITLGKLLYSEERQKHSMRRNFLEDKEHLEKAGIPDYEQPPILYGRPC